MPRTQRKPAAEPLERERKVDEVDYTDNIAHVSIEISKRQPKSQADVIAALRALDAANIRISLLKVHPGVMDFVVEGNLRAQQIEAVVNRPVRVMSGCAIVAIKSDSMRFLHGIMAQAVQALSSHGIDVLETGDAHDAVFCVIDGKHLRKALETLRRQFAL